MLFNIRAVNGNPEILLYGEISASKFWGDETTVKELAEELDKYKGQDITVRINSPGGDFFAGAAMYTALKSHGGKVTVKIEGLAASAASLVAMAGDEISISPVGTIMIHKASIMTYANADEIEKTKEVLSKVDEIMVSAYSEKTGKNRDEILDMMSLETWLAAEEAVSEGFATSVTDFTKERSGLVKAVAWANTSEALNYMANSADAIAEKQYRQQIVDENKKILEKLN